MRGESRLYTMAYVISNNYNLDKTIMYMHTREYMYVVIKYAIKLFRPPSDGGLMIPPWTFCGGFW